MNLVILILSLATLNALSENLLYGFIAGVVILSLGIYTNYVFGGKP